MTIGEAIKVIEMEQAKTGMDFYPDRRKAFEMALSALRDIRRREAAEKEDKDE